jgi:hypothetical protein
MNFKPYLKKLIGSALLATLALTARLGIAQSTDDSATTPATDYSAFQLIPQRNIFNPNRYPNEPVNFHPQASQQVPEFTLVGTMSYRKGMFAFFNGTDPEYQKAVQEGGTIAGFTITNINLTGVLLLSTNMSTNMMVGQAMEQQGDGWALNDNGMTFSGISGASSFRGGREGREGNGRRRRGNYGESNSNEQTAPAIEAAPAPSSDLSGNDVLKKLMQQRQQEEK